MRLAGSDHQTSIHAGNISATSLNSNEKECVMNKSSEYALSKVPEITLIFWIIKIAATTLGETGGDAVSMSMNLGYLVGTGIFAAIFLVAVLAQIKTKGFHPFLYWSTIIATTTVGTTMADFADRSLGIGYVGGSSLLFILLMASLAIWYRTLGSVSDTLEAPRCYWPCCWDPCSSGIARWGRYPLPASARPKRKCSIG
jgi:uncharacterized membrane-anchored protein